jgi:hypothetical protein
MRSGLRAIRETPVNHPTGCGVEANSFPKDTHRFESMVKRKHTTFWGVEVAVPATIHRLMSFAVVQPLLWVGMVHVVHFVEVPGQNGVHIEHCADRRITRLHSTELSYNFVLRMLFWVGLVTEAL